MGCTTSKQSDRKGAAERESWYAPLSRSISAPIRYPQEDDDEEQEISHVVSLASSSYDIMKMNGPGEHADSGDSAYIAKNLPDKDLGFALQKAGPKKAFSGSKLRPLKETIEGEEELETINTWELMEGLEEEEEELSRVSFDTSASIGRSSLMSSPPRTPARAKCRIVEKSLSFNTVHGLDSCFSEIGSPLWQKSSVHKKLEEGQCCSEDLEQYGASQNPMRSPFRSPLRSPLMGSNSPLFDPSLMATFEQALEAINLPEGDWMLLNPNHQKTTPSTSSASASASSSSAPSSNNTAWTLSETSSDAESELSTSNVREGQYKECFKQIEQPYEMVSSMSNRKSKEVNLYSFEARCPPRGEEKVVLYFTSLRGVRKTYEDCCTLRLILQGLGVCVDERDVWMHSTFREELTDLLGAKKVQVPRLFIKGRYIGGAEEVKQLHEDGVLIRLIEDLATFGLFRKTCEGCASMRFIPCLTCSGSCKVLDGKDSTTRCPDCNENGLIMCPMCSSE